MSARIYRWGGSSPAADFLNWLCFCVLADLLDYLEAIEEQWYSIAQDVLDCNYTLSIGDRNETFRKIKNFYFGNMSISIETADAFIKVI